MQVHEFVFMPNHVHLLITPAPDVSLEKAMQFIKGGFSYRAGKELGSEARFGIRASTNIGFATQPATPAMFDIST